MIIRRTLSGQFVATIKGRHDGSVYAAINANRKTVMAEVLQMLKDHEKAMGGGSK